LGYRYFFGTQLTLIDQMELLFLCRVLRDTVHGEIRISASSHPFSDSRRGEGHKEEVEVCSSQAALRTTAGWRTTWRGQTAEPEGEQRPRVGGKGWSDALPGAAARTGATREDGQEEEEPETETMPTPSHLDPRAGQRTGSLHLDHCSAAQGTGMQTRPSPACTRSRT
jgi:hypothetical protein